MSMKYALSKKKKKEQRRIYIFLHHIRDESFFLKRVEDHGKELVISLSLSFIRPLMFSLNKKAVLSEKRLLNSRWLRRVP